LRKRQNKNKTHDEEAAKKYRQKGEQGEQQSKEEQV
jgi:hypothetical protein